MANVFGPDVRDETACQTEAQQLTRPHLHAANDRQPAVAGPQQDSTLLPEHA
jgi:hypothetical protein